MSFAFTTIVVNYTSTAWHNDPTDTGFTVILFLGDFDGGEFCLGPPVNKKIPVKSGDIMLVNSAFIFHKAAIYTGTRFSIGCYCKSTNLKQNCRELIIPETVRWALKK